MRRISLGADGRIEPYGAAIGMGVRNQQHSLSMPELTERTIEHALMHLARERGVLRAAEQWAAGEHHVVAGAEGPRLEAEDVEQLDDGSDRLVCGLPHHRATAPFLAERPRRGPGLREVGEMRGNGTDEAGIVLITQRTPPGLREGVRLRWPPGKALRHRRDIEQLAPHQPFQLLPCGVRMPPQALHEVMESDGSLVTEIGDGLEHPLRRWTHTLVHAAPFLHFNYRYSGVVTEPGDLTLTPTSSAFGCGHEHSTDAPKLDARLIPHAIRHGAILGALGQVRPGSAMVLVAPHNPLPLLAQIAQQFEDVSVSYLVEGPEEWQLLLTRA